MFSPPRVAALRKVPTAPSSIAFMSVAFWVFFLPRLTLARQVTHRASSVPSLLRRKWSGLGGNACPQSMQVRSLTGQPAVRR